MKMTLTNNLNFKVTVAGWGLLKENGDQPSKVSGF